MLQYLSKEQIESYNTDGFLHLHAIYTPDAVSRARELIEEDLLNGGWTSAPVYDKGHTTDIYERIPELAEIVFNDNFLKAMSDLFSPTPIILAEPVIHRSRYYYWHKDSTFLDEQGESFHWQPDFRASMTVMYLQANHPKYGGGITVVPRTQNQPDFYHTIAKMNLLQRAILKGKKVFKQSHFDKLDRHPDLHPIPTEVGDLLVLDMRLDHKGTPATAPAPHMKYGIMNIACSGQKTAKNLQQALRRRPSAYYQEYLSKLPDSTPVLESISQAKGITIWV